MTPLLNRTHVRHVGVTWLLFFVGHLYLTGMHLGEDQEQTIMKTRI
jgi:hypothetical protein